MPGGARCAVAVGASEPPASHRFCGVFVPICSSRLRCWGLRGAGGTWGCPGGALEERGVTEEPQFFGAGSGVPAVPRGTGGLWGSCRPPPNGAMSCGDPKVAVGRGVWGGRGQHR